MGTRKPEPELTTATFDWKKRVHGEAKPKLEGRKWKERDYRKR